MARARLTIDLGAVVANWRALDAMTSCETAAVVKADAYGVGAARVGAALHAAGVRSFFVALAEEGAELRGAIGPEPTIYVFSGLMPGDERLVRSQNLIPLVNSPDQVRAAQSLYASTGATQPIGLQLDSGMNRLGLEPSELATLLDDPGGLAGLDIRLVMSHLACADEPGHPQNEVQRAAFDAMTAALPPQIPRSLAATGGVLLGERYHYDLTRPGVGLYGGSPFAQAAAVVTLEAPIIQIRDVARGETVGYGASFEAETDRRIATLSLGYADGMIRALGDGFAMNVAGRSVRSVGRVSMDLITLDVTDVPGAKEGAMASILSPNLTIDDLAAAANTIGYEILTSLGARYERRYTGP